MERHDCDICGLPIHNTMFLFVLTNYPMEHLDKTNTQTLTLQQSIDRYDRQVKNLQSRTKRFEICEECQKVITSLFKIRKNKIQDLKNNVNNILCLPLKTEPRRDKMSSISDLPALPNVYFVGKAGAGKTYSAKHLIQSYGYVTSKFAYPVYGLATNYFGMVNKDRELLQLIGTDVGRAMINDNIWVNRFIEDLAIVKEVYRCKYNKIVHFVSDDVRFINEHNVLKYKGWLGIYLDVPENTRIQRLKGRDGDAQIKTLGHSSETSIDSFKKDLIKIDASDTIEETQKNVEKVLYDYLKGK